MLPADANTDLLPHEIAGPVWYLPYPMWMMLTAAVVLIVVLAAAVWAFVAWRRHRHQRTPEPREAAILALGLLRARMDQADSYEYSIAICEIVRSFLAAVHKLPAPKLTSYEFLKAAQSMQLFDEERMGHLSRFLEKADSIKFARASAGAEDNKELTDLAEDLVKGGTPDAAAA